MSDEKRKRSPNWLPSEKLLLLQLVEKHIKIVENKKTDGVSVRAKLAEWQEISIEYNSQTSHCHREAENLKNQWENMKKAAKKEASNARMQRIQTGGGPPEQKKEDPVVSRIISLIHTSAVGLYNPNDSDCVVPAQADTEDAETAIDDVQKIIDVEIVEDVNVGDSVEVEMMDWGDYTPQLLKTPVSAPLKMKNKNKSTMSRRRPLNAATSSSIDLLHQSKIDAIHLQKALAEKEAESNKIISEIDIQIKKEILKQEKIKTRLLLLELRKKKKE